MKIQDCKVGTMVKVYDSSLKARGVIRAVGVVGSTLVTVRIDFNQVPGMNGTHDLAVFPQQLRKLVKKTQPLVPQDTDDCANCGHAYLLHPGKRCTHWKRARALQYCFCAGFVPKPKTNDGPPREVYVNFYGDKTMLTHLTLVTADHYACSAGNRKHGKAIKYVLAE